MILRSVQLDIDGGIYYYYHVLVLFWDKGSGG